MNAVVEARARLCMAREVLDEAQALLGVQGVAAWPAVMQRLQHASLLMNQAASWRPGEELWASASAAGVLEAARPEVA